LIDKIIFQEFYGDHGPVSSSLLRQVGYRAFLLISIYRRFVTLPFRQGQKEIGKQGTINVCSFQSTNWAIFCDSY